MGNSDSLMRPDGTSFPYIHQLPLNAGIAQGLPCSLAWLRLRVTPATCGSLSVGFGSYR
jgi:hypothetical protein